MQTLFIGFVEDSVEPFMKGIAIRITYLLSARLRISGNISNYFLLEESLRNMSYEGKLKYIDDREKNNPDPPLLYQNHKKVQKLYKKSKSHQKEFIVYQKQAEKTINQIFNRMVDDTIRHGKNSGLLDLKPIMDSSFYGEYFIRYDDAEDVKDECNKLSEMLQLKLDDDDIENATIFVLNYSLFSPDFEVANDIELDEFSEKGFLQELFVFPNYNDFSVTDLNTIRFEVNKSLEDFQQSVNVFTTLSATPTEAFDYLHTNVVISAKKLAEDISKIGFVENYNKIMSYVPACCKLYLGMIPRYIVFKYFEFIKASREETIAILEKLTDDEKNELVPVLLVTIYNEHLEDKIAPDTTTEELLPFKKSLSID